MPKRRGNAATASKRVRSSTTARFIVPVAQQQHLIESVPIPEAMDSVEESQLQLTTWDSLLEWRPGAGSYLKKARVGQSRWKRWRDKKKEIMKRQSVLGCRPLTSFFAAAGRQVMPLTAPVLQQVEKPKPVKRKKSLIEIERIQEIYPQLHDKVCQLRNSESEVGSLNAYEALRLLSVHCYFKNRVLGCTKEQASMKAATSFWIKSYEYRRRSIISWAKTYLLLGALPQHQQGRHTKRESLLNDEDIKRRCISFIKSVNPERRSLIMLKNELTDKIIPEVLGVPGTVAETTISRYLHVWGYRYKRYSKNIYYDGHERPDVKSYRLEWATRMMHFRQFMCQFSGENMDIVTRPLLNEYTKEHVLVTHDESTFYSNDAKDDMWITYGESVLRKKGPGGSIMVSDFLCACHGPLKITQEQSNQNHLPEEHPLEARVYFKAGKNNEGWWTSDHMIAQLDIAIRIFDILHPDCVGVFAFDQSSNHAAYPKDALLANRMTLGDKKKEDLAFPFKKWGYTYDQEGIPIRYNFYYTENVRSKAGKRYEVTYMKGIKKILHERGKWPEDRRVNLFCGIPTSTEGNCCARHILEKEPDFKAQKSALNEAVRKAGHIFELYPKFHCETNFIERYWGKVKREARLNCDYSYRSLEQNLPNFLDSVGLDQIRRFSGKAWGFIELYANGKDGYEAEKLYKSHRRIGHNQ